MRSILLLTVLVASGCAHASKEELVPYVCQERPPANAGQSLEFAGAVGEMAVNALHMDFDGFGADFNSVRLTFVSPQEWKGRSVPVYYQGNARVEGREVSSGDLLLFKAVVPECLDGPWLFLEEMEPQLSRPE